MLIILGLLCTGVGVLGIVTPVLPTTPFLLLAAGLFARSSPQLRRRLLSNRITGPYLRAYTQGAGLSRRRKLATISVLWVALAVSAWFTREHWWALAVLGAVGVAVTAHIATLRSRGGAGRAEAAQGTTTHAPPDRIV